VATLCRELATESVAQAIASGYAAAWQAGRERGRAEGEIARLERAERSLVAAIASGEIPDPTSLARELASTQRQLRALRARLRDDLAPPQWITPAAVRSALLRASMTLGQMRLGDKELRAVLHRLVAGVRILDKREAELDLRWRSVLTSGDRTDEWVLTPLVEPIRFLAAA